MRTLARQPVSEKLRLAETVKTLVLDNEFCATIGELGAEYPEFRLYCPQETEDPVELAGTQSFHCLITKIAPVDRGLLDKLPDLKLLLKMGRRYTNVDIEAVRDRGIPLACSPRKGPNCVAEHAMTLILALSKDLIITHGSVTSGAYRSRGLRPALTSQKKMAFRWMENQRIQEVRGKRLGIVGMGEIGCELARRAHVMGMEICYYNRTKLPPEIEARFSAEYRPLDELLATSDFVTLAVPQTPETEGLIGAEQLSAMKPTAFLVNVCRGSVVDEQALIRTLQNDEIAGAGLDVFVYEPLPANSALCALDNVILTAHIGGGTGTNKTLELGDALEEAIHILRGNQAHVGVV
jgi:phosphogluconate 2-dehydrogenase